MRPGEYSEVKVLIKNVILMKEVIVFSHWKNSIRFCDKNNWNIFLSNRIVILFVEKGIVTKNLDNPVLHIPYR